MAEANNNLCRNNMLIKIHSKYIVIKIFENLTQNKLLNIINYNKSYQKLMNKKIIDYIREFSKIEIEIFPKENTYGKIINNYNKSIHIFFNDNEKEIKRKIITKEDNIIKIKIIIDYKVKSFFFLFYGCKCIKKVNFIKFNKVDIKNMCCMFYGCSSLEEINLSNFKTNNVTTMAHMFKGCSSLKYLNLSNFSTNNLINMGGMFKGCSSLKEINLKNFKTNNVINMDNMFEGCSSISEINLSNFNTSNVKYMNQMFKGCSSLKELNLSSFNINIGTESNEMFKDCSSLQSLICDNLLIKKEYENH